MKANIKVKKSFKKVPLPLKVVLNKMYKKYGLVSLEIIDNMTSPDYNEKELMKEYINKIDKKGATSDGLDPS